MDLLQLEDHMFLVSGYLSQFHVNQHPHFTVTFLVILDASGIVSSPTPPKQPSHSSAFLQSDTLSRTNLLQQFKLVSGFPLVEGLGTMRPRPASESVKATCILIFVLRHLKDVILLTAIIQVLSCFSLYVWYFWLLVSFFFPSISPSWCFLNPQPFSLSIATVDPKSMSFVISSVYSFCLRKIMQSSLYIQSQTKFDLFMISCNGSKIWGPEPF